MLSKAAATWQDSSLSRAIPVPDWSQSERMPVY
jgi:hypothetical protein